MHNFPEPVGEEVVQNGHFKGTLAGEPWDYKWKDITKEFINASSELKLGQLLHDNKFSLFEAMSAIELMDPKMDAGMIRTRKPLGFDGAVEAGKLYLNNLDLSYSLTIMDASLSCLVTWLEGHPMANTLFTNLYLHKPFQINDHPIKAFSAGLLKLTWICKEIIGSAGVFEEEDFHVMIYGFDLLTGTSFNHIITMLRDTEEEMLKSIKKIKAHSPNSSADSSTGSDESNIIELTEAIVSRLRLVRLLSTALSRFVAICDVPEKPKQARVTSQNLEEAERSLRSCEQNLEKIVSTLSLGFSPPENKQDEDFGWLNGFEPGVNRRLLPPTFPRKTRMFNRQESIAYLQNLVWRLLLISVSLPQKITSFSAALSFFREFSCKTRNCILSRSVLQLAYLPTEHTVLGQLEFSDVVKDSIRAFVSPPVLQQKSPILENEKCEQVWSEFIGDCCKVMGSLVQICGHNRSRQREKLIPAIEDLAALQAEADRADGLFHSILQNMEPERQHVQTLGAYVLYHTLSLMREYFVLGFELELFASHEYAYVYWYMGELVYKWLANVVDRASNFMLREMQLGNHEAAKSKKKSRAKREIERKRRLFMGTEEILYWQALEKICEAFFKVTLGLESTNKILSPRPEDDKIRYEHRMTAFACLNTPPYVRYEQYVMSSRHIFMTFQSDGLFKTGADAFDEARSLLSHLDNVPAYQQEVSCLSKVCKNNAVVIRLLASGHKKDSAEPPIFDFSVHKHFPLLRIS